MATKDGEYKCPTCQIVGSIEGRSITVTITGGQNWPLHSDCEWAKTIDDLDVTKLEKVS